jgi:hypothetical protein
MAWRNTTHLEIEENHPLVQAGESAFQGLFGKAPLVDKWTFSTNGGPSTDTTVSHVSDLVPETKYLHMPPRKGSGE